MQRGRRGVPQRQVPVVLRNNGPRIEPNIAVASEPGDGAERAVVQPLAVLGFAVAGDPHAVALGDRRGAGVEHVEARGLVERQRFGFVATTDRNALVGSRRHIPALAAAEARRVLPELHHIAHQVARRIAALGDRQVGARQRGESPLLAERAVRV